ncbi:Alanine racemase [compost metagenome]
MGYADGLSRKLGNGVGEMLVNGKHAPIIGSVCMDMTMLNVTGIDCKETDEVIVFNEELRVEELAEKIGTIPYEVLTGISQRVKRVYVYE